MKRLIFHIERSLSRFCGHAPIVRQHPLSHFHRALGAKITIAIALLSASLVSAQEVAKLLPFQGRLTDANGTAIGGGSKVVQFKIYNAPVGGQAVWNGEVQKLTVNGGLVSTTLGTKASLTGVDFNRNLYLELTIDANDDGQISVADPPLLPRQSIVPAVFAIESGDSRKLAGHDWSSILVSGNDPANGFIRGDKLNTNSITAAQIAAKTITANQIADATITAGQIATNTITANQIADATITSSKLSSILSISAASVTSGTLPDARLSGNVALRSGGNIFSGNQSVNGNVVVNDRLGIRTSSPVGVLDVNTGGGTVSVRNEGPTPGLVMTGGTVPGTLRLRDALEVWPNLTGTSAGRIDVRDYTGFPNIRLTGTNGRVRAISFDATSDRDAKQNFREVDVRQILDRVAELPISRWNFKADPGPEHIGPVAQDFHAAFGLGTDDKHISTVDAGGVALAAIQGLNQKVEEQSTELHDKDAELQSVKKRLAELERIILTLSPTPSP